MRNTAGRWPVGRAREGGGGCGPLEELHQAGLAGVEGQLRRDGDGEDGYEQGAEHHGQEAEEAAQVGERVDVAVADRGGGDHHEPELVPEVELLRVDRRLGDAHEVRQDEDGEDEGQGDGLERHVVQDCLRSDGRRRPARVGYRELIGSNRSGCEGCGAGSRQGGRGGQGEVKGASVAGTP